jgi:hypothetical protein
MVPSNDLDSVDAVCWTLQHTEILVGNLEPGVLWDNYGLVANIIVSAPSLQFLFLSNYLQPFTNDFPQADIHELIVPNLLHQLIKGVFKDDIDHLVSWVGQYLESTYGKPRANKILADIDCR